MKSMPKTGKQSKHSFKLQFKKRANCNQQLGPWKQNPPSGSFGSISVIYLKHLEVVECSVYVNFLSISYLDVDISRCFFQHIADLFQTTLIYSTYTRSTPRTVEAHYNRALCRFCATKRHLLITFPATMYYLVLLFIYILNAKR